VSARRAAAVIAFWGGLNVVLSTLMFAFTTDVMSHVVYWAANAIVFVVAALALAARETDHRVLPEASAGTFAVAGGVAFMALGAGIGSWAVFVGGAIVLLGLVLLGIEWWA
jgi:hypothetical protein